MIARIFISTLILTAYVASAYGQIGQRGRVPTSDDPLTKLDSSRSDIKTVLPDTTIFDHFTIDDIARQLPFQDTTLDAFHIYKDVNHQQPFAADLGNPGSASFPLFFQRQKRTLRDVGFEQYDIYKYTRSSFHHYDVNRPLADFSFSVGGSQDNFNIHSLFARNFADSLSMTLDYNRINQQGFYSSQETQTTSLGLGFRKKLKNADIFLTSISNAHNEQFNGGISNILDLTENFGSFRQNIDTKVSDVGSRHIEIDISLNVFYYLLRDAGSNFITLRNELTWWSGDYLLSDDNAAHTEFFGPYWNDDRGLRHHISHKAIRNHSSVHIGLSDRLQLSGGLMLAHNRLDNEFQNEKRNEVALTGDARLKLSSVIELNSKLFLGLISNSNFESNTEASLSLLNLDLNAGLRLYSHAPDWIDEELSINGQAIWSNDLSNSIGSEIYGKLHYDKIGLSAWVKLHAIDQAIYYENQGTVSSSDELFSVGQFLVEEKLNVGPLHISLLGGYQTFNENLYNLPNLIAESNIYLRSFLFKRRLESRFGVYARYLPAYQANSFMPVNGAFFRDTNAPELDTFIPIDLYTSFKVGNFRAFLNAENLNQLVFNDVFFMVNDYPQFDFKIRFGVGWLLKD